MFAKLQFLFFFLLLKALKKLACYGAQRVQGVIIKGKKKKKKLRSNFAVRNEFSYC